MPAVGEPLRVAFVGAQPESDACVPHAPAGGIAPSFVDARAEADASELRAALVAAAPHVVVALDAARVPAEAFDDLGAAALGIGDGAAPGHYDRIASTSGTGAADAWRSFALPVDDRLYAAVRERPSARALFMGASTEYLERFLMDPKHEHDLLHYAHGLWGDELRQVLGAVGVGVNVHSDSRPAFEHRVLVHLAAGHLLVSEPLAPARGLEPELDYVPVVRSDELLRVLRALRKRPELHDRVRHSGRLKAEAHRASRVWPRIVGDLLDDIAAFGSDRAP